MTKKRTVVIVGKRIGIEIEREIGEGVGVEVDPEMTMENEIKEAVQDLEIEATEVAETTNQKKDLVGENLQYIGMLHHPDSNTLHPYNTRPCRHPEKYLLL